MNAILLFLCPYIVWATETSYLNIPTSFKPYIETIRWAFEKDENGQSQKTLRDIKTRVDPLKDDFFKLLENPVVFTYYEKFSEIINNVCKIYEQKSQHLHEQLVLEKISILKNRTTEEMTNHLIEKIGDLSKSVISDDMASQITSKVTCHDDLEQLPPEYKDQLSLESLRKFIIKGTNPEKSAIDSILNIFSKIKKTYDTIKIEGYKSKDFFQKSIAYDVQYLPLYTLNEHLPLEFKKLLFPFYMLETFGILISINKIQFNWAKEGWHHYEEEDVDNINDHIIDLEDKLDLPFFESFDIVLEKSYFNTSPEDKEPKLINNFLLVFDQFVRFSPFFEFEFDNEKSPFQKPLELKDVKF